MNAKELLSAPPVLYSNFFSEKDIETIYKIINDAITLGESDGNKYKHFFVQRNGMHRLSFAKYEESAYIKNPKEVHDLLKGLENRISGIIGKDIINLNGYFARYSRESGFDPGLPPHIDEAEFGQNYRMSLTSKLKSTIEWDVGVEKDRWKLKDNEALVFSANLYSHWRPKNEMFTEDDFYDIMVLHFDFKGLTRIPIDQDYFDKKESILKNRNIRDSYERTKQ